MAHHGTEVGACLPLVELLLLLLLLLFGGVASTVRSNWSTARGRHVAIMTDHPHLSPAAAASAILHLLLQGCRGRQLRRGRRGETMEVLVLVLLLLLLRDDVASIPRVSSVHGQVRDYQLAFPAIGVQLVRPVSLHRRGGRVVEGGMQLYLENRVHTLFAVDNMLSAFDCSHHTALAARTHATSSQSRKERPD